MVVTAIVMIVVVGVVIVTTAVTIVVTIAIATAVGATVSGAASSGIVAAIEAPRPIVQAVTSDGSTGPDRILVGITDDGRDLLLDADDPSIRMMEPATARVVVGTTTIAEAFEDSD